jgi:hypothetical protein
MTALRFVQMTAFAILMAGGQQSLSSTGEYYGNTVSLVVWGQTRPVKLIHVRGVAITG